MYQNRFDQNLTLVKVDPETVLYINLDLEHERYARMKDILFEHGQVYRNNSFADYRYPKLPEERCYDAAVKFSKWYGLRYVEGVVLIEVGGEIYPYAHGWCVDSDDKVVDPTLWKHQHKRQLHYYGIPIKMAYVDEQYKQTGFYGLLDGRPDGAPEGIYNTPVDWWLDR